MRADTTFIASLLAASAAAQAAYNETGNSTEIDNSYSNQKIVSELEAEVAALKHQLETAETGTCDTAPVAGGDKPAATGAPAPTSSSAPPFYTGDEDSEDKPATKKPQGYSGETNTPKGDDESSPVSPAEEDKPATTKAPESPAGYSDNKGTSSEGSSNQGSGSSNHGSSGPTEDHKRDGDYYMPNAPSSDAKSTSTKTVIVTAGQTETVKQTQTQTLTRTATEAEATGDSDVEIVTATETYCGKGPIPSPPTEEEKSRVPTGAGASSGSTNKPSNVLSSATRPAGYHSSAASSALSSVLSSTNGYFQNGTLTATGSGAVPTFPASSGLLTTTRGASSGIESLTSSSSVALSTGATGTVRPSGTGVSSSTSSASATSTAEVDISDCATFCETLTEFDGYEVTPMTCTQRPAGVSVDTPSGQSSVSCAASFTPEVDLCQVTLNVKTSGTAETYMEVWLPNGDDTEWNGRSMNTDNGGLNGCIHYVDMQYVTGLGFAAIGDNAGHNGSSFDGTWTMNNNEAIIDWSYRARHAAVEIGKETIDQFYSKPADYSYYVGCSAGGAQGVQSAEMFPNDFDGIIAGAAANDFNHLQGWSATFATITGQNGNDTYLSLADWTIVQTYVLEQCDEAIDGVADGILEDPTQCKFDASAIPTCSGEDDTTECLSATQKQTVEDIFKPLYNNNGDLIYPALFPGSQVDAFKLGLLNGNPQGIARDWFRGAVFNDSSYDISSITVDDIELAQSQDDLHGNPSAFSAQLGDFSAAGKKFMMYHGMADPMTSGGNAQRYYLKVANELGLDHTEIDNFFRLFRISGMAHCGVGGISGAGAWQFGQNGAAASATNNIVDNLVNWVENDEAPETLLGTKFWYDTPSYGVMFERAHCRFPYRTTYQSGDSTLPESWSCELIENWTDCADEFCSADGTFT